MSTTSMFALGLGGGLALWYATQMRPARAAAGHVVAPVADEPTTVRNARRGTREASAAKPRGASRARPRYTHAGRTILRDGDAILYVDRVDLGDQRYAVSPHEADQLTARMVRLLDRHGSR